MLLCFECFLLHGKAGAGNAKRRSVGATLEGLDLGPSRDDEKQIALRERPNNFRLNFTTAFIVSKVKK